MPRLLTFGLVRKDLTLEIYYERIVGDSISGALEQLSVESFVDLSLDSLSSEESLAYK